MKYCRNCGRPMDDDATVCPNCGASQLTTAPNGVDNGGLGWGLLGCCIPIAGLILFLVWKDTKPNTARAAGLGALVSVVLSVVWYLICFVFGLGAAFFGIA